MDGERRPLAGPARAPGPSPEDALASVRSVFFEEADELLAKIETRLANLSQNQGSPSDLNEIAARGHTLRGSAALAELPAVSTVGTILEIAATLALEQAESNHLRTRRLACEALVALDPARRLIETARRGDSAPQEELLREVRESFSSAFRPQLEAVLEEYRNPSVQAQTLHPQSSTDPENAAGSGPVPPASPDRPLAATTVSTPDRFARTHRNTPIDTTFDPHPEQPPGIPAFPDEDSGEAAHIVTKGTPEQDLAAQLAEVFREEFRELLCDVPEKLRGLIDPAAQQRICGELERIFHTIKGSAATVGLDRERDFARNLQETFEEVTEDENGTPLDPEFAARIAAPIREIFALAALDHPVEEISRLEEALRASVVDAPDLETAQPDPKTHIVPTPEDLPDPTTARSASPKVEPEIMEAFTIDAEAALDGCEDALAALAREPNDPDPLHSLFRQFHTLKGAAAAVGLERIAEQLHCGETLLETILEQGAAADTESLRDLLVEILDSVTGLIDQAYGKDPAHRILPDVAARIAEWTSADAPQPIRSAPAVEASGPEAAPSPPAQLEPNSTTTVSPTGAESDSTIVRVHASRLDLLMNRVSELVVSRTRMDDSINTILDLRERLNRDRLQLNETVEGFRGFEFNSNPTAEDGGGAAVTGSREEFTDLEFDKYDDFNVLTRTLVELAADTGEMLEELSVTLDGLSEEGRQVSKISSSLQRAVSTMRLQSLESLFRRLQRSIRDATRQLGREVEVRAIGGDVQLDRGLIESLYGPLLHVVRNAVSHGIEPPEQRESNGKPRTGQITLEAQRQQGSVEIIVRDDGRGLDFDAIRAKAIRSGLLAADEEIERGDLARMILRPGFSTKDQVTDLAGRGIGMDVVLSEVEQLRGNVGIESADGNGTTFRITVPLATMIEQALIVRAGNQSFGLSQAPVETVLHVEPEQIVDTANGTSLVVGEGRRVPALALPALAGISAGVPTTAILLREGEHEMALLVDRIEAQREAVIRPLGRLFSGHPFITSATFAGDGQVVFLLDTRRLPALLGQAGFRAIPGPSREEPETTAPGAEILWVDDSISVRKLASVFLRDEGLTAETAVDGIDALEKLREGHFRVVVTDLEMPRMHGYELLKEIRRDSRFQNLPVIVCSSRSSEKHQRRAREAGADGYLTKPFTQETLAATLRESRSLPRPFPAPGHDKPSGT